MPEDMPDRMLNRMPENMPDRMPEDLPVTKCINVMVGITRSKVFFYVQQQLFTKIIKRAGSQGHVFHPNHRTAGHATGGGMGFHMVKESQQHVMIILDHPRSLHSWGLQT